jgi:hypothetical protein
MAADYISGYMCKGMEGGFHGLVDANITALNSLNQDSEGYKGILKMLNQSVGCRDISDPNCSHELLGLPLTRSSVQFRILPLGNFRQINASAKGQESANDCNDEMGVDSESAKPKPSVKAGKYC